MPGLLGELFIHLDWSTAMQVALLGFMGGVLSGFIGSGGAFFMTPGMMNLGVMGPVAVASNITHKFGKAIVGSKKHGEMGNVDKKLSIFMLITAVAGIQLAAWVMKIMFNVEGEHGEKSAAADLYISVIFMVVLSIVAVCMLRDIIKSRASQTTGPSMRIVNLLAKFRLHPMIYFPVADVRVSLWVILICGLATGYLAGTIGVGGFIGVPAMIYIFGVPAAVAAGTELFLALFMGAVGALTYAFQGMVDIRLTLLLYVGSLLGIHLGAYGTKVVKEVVIRLVTATIILICVISRTVAMPIYLKKLDYFSMSTQWENLLSEASKYLLYAGGITGTAIILYMVLKAFFHRRKIEASLTASVPKDSESVAVPEGRVV